MTAKTKIQIRDRIVELRRVRAGDLKAHAKNWRRHPERQQKAMRAVLKEIGFADALLAREPQIHIFPSEPYPFVEEKHWGLVEQLFGNDSRRLFVEGDDYCWHGVRTLEGLEAVRILREIALSAS